MIEHHSHTVPHREEPKENLPIFGIKSLRKFTSFLLAVGVNGNPDGGLDVVAFGDGKIPRLVIIDGPGNEYEYSPEELAEVRLPFETQAQQLLANGAEYPSSAASYGVAEFNEKDSILTIARKSGISAIVYSHNPNTDEFVPNVTFLGVDSYNPKTEITRTELKPGSHLVVLCTDGALDLFMNPFFVELSLGYDDESKDDFVSRRDALSKLQASNSKGTQDDLLILLKPLTRRINDLVKGGRPLDETLSGKQNILPSDSYPAHYIAKIRRNRGLRADDDAALVLSPIYVP